MLASGTLIVWLQQNGWYIVMALAGGAVAHVQLYEKEQHEWKWRQHVGSLVICCTKSLFVMFIIYNARIEWKWSEPLSLILTGLCGVFANDALSTFYNFIKRVLRLDQYPPKDPPSAKDREEKDDKDA